LGTRKNLSEFIVEVRLIEECREVTLDLKITNELLDKMNILPTQPSLLPKSTQLHLHPLVTPKPDEQQLEHH
jgi:hypothetical protein